MADLQPIPEHTAAARDAIAGEITRRVLGGRVAGPDELLVGIPGLLSRLEASVTRSLEAAGFVLDRWQHRFLEHLVAGHVYAHQPLTLSRARHAGRRRP